MTTGFVWHERYLWHNTGRQTGPFQADAGGWLEPDVRHRENADGKRRLYSLLAVSGLLDQLAPIAPSPATEEQLLRFHTPDYLARIRAESEAWGGDGGDGATPFGRGSYEVAKLSAGGVIAAFDAVIGGAVRNAYALVRPPGHHARPETGMGYCLFSNVCVAIEQLRAVHGVGRVAIVDYDVHHGNGAQAIYWDDPDVLTISLHQDRLFPQDSGMVEERGGAGAEGACINVPLPAGSGNGAYLAAVDRVVTPALRAFAPELIMVSSGFDPSAVDPLGCMTVTAAGFRGIAERLVAVAQELCDGRLVFSHEGGYSPVHAPFCGLAVLEALSGHETGVEDPFDAAFARSPAHPLKPWQDELIAEAEQVARLLAERALS